MKTKIIEKQFLVSIMYLDDVYHSLENVIHRTYFTDFANGGKDFVEMTKLVEYEQIKDWQ